MKKILAVVFVVLLILIIVGVIVVNRSIVHIQLPHHAILLLGNSYGDNMALEHLV